MVVVVVVVVVVVMVVVTGIYGGLVRKKISLVSSSHRALIFCKQNPQCL